MQKRWYKASFCVNILIQAREGQPKMSLLIFACEWVAESGLCRYNHIMIQATEEKNRCKRQEKIMLKLYSEKKTEQILQRYSFFIGNIAEKYHVPSALIKAVLYQEMIQIDLMDALADFCVLLRIPKRTDSSTGYAQIFGYVGLKAVNFAVDQGLATYESLKIDCGHRLDEGNPKDVRYIWKKLHSDKRSNIEIAVLNILSCAEEKTGKIDFGSYSEQELKRILTRYNANVDFITRYGEEAYRNFLRYQKKPE